MGSAFSHQLIRKGKSMTILTVGIDLAKNVFAVNGVNETGRAELVRPAVARNKLIALLATLPPCAIGIQACSGTPHWARQFQALGHTVRLVSPKFVTSHRMSGKRSKTDPANAAAICETIQRPRMRFVPIKSLDQQSRTGQSPKVVARQAVQQHCALVNHYRSDTQPDLRQHRLSRHQLSLTAPVGAPGSAPPKRSRGHAPGGAGTSTAPPVPCA
jgi:transposase